MDNTKKRIEAHSENHRLLWDLRLHETMNFSTSPIDGKGPVIEWQVMRVDTGWIYIEDNQRITRPPMTLFVPLITYTNPNV